MPCLHRSVKIVSWVFGAYGAQFLLMPGMIIDQHFDFAPDENHIFFGRGTGVPMLALAYVLTKLPVDEAVKIAFYTVVATALVYPINAAYISKLAVKYPMHYVPEVLMTGLTVAGFLAQ